MKDKKVIIKSSDGKSQIKIHIWDKIRSHDHTNGVASDYYLVEDEKGNVFQIDPKDIIKII
jgi:hypothetical protein